MNILPKKSWHVRTKKNIERVRRDEAEAERLSKLEQDRILHVQQEARARDIRAKAGIAEPQGHFNLFEPSLVSTFATNREHEEEKQRDKEKWEQKVGISKKLVRSEDIDQPWYARATTTSSAVKEDRKLPESNLVMSMYDPMTTMKHAEEIVRAKKIERRKQERIAQQARDKLLMYHQRYSGQASSSSSQLLVGCQKKSQESRLLQSDSSPECVKIVRKSDKSADISELKSYVEPHKKERRSSHTSSKHHRHHRDRNRHKKHVK